MASSQNVNRPGNDDQQQKIDTLRSNIAAGIVAHRKFFLFEGIVMIVLGALAISYPLYGSIAVTTLIGWLFLIGGALRLGVRLSTRSRSSLMPGNGWALAAAVLAIIMGLVLISQPLQGMLTLTAILIVIFLVEGVAGIFAAFSFRQHSASWIWVLLSGIANVVLALLIWQGWPDTAAWAIGVLTGINLIFTGFAVVMLAVAAGRGHSS